MSRRKELNYVTKQIFLFILLLIAITSVTTALYIDEFNVNLQNENIVETNVTTYDENKLIAKTLPCEAIPEPICPPYNFSVPYVYLSDPKDCNKFYICNRGIPYARNCPAGLHYNRNLKVCDFPRGASCDCLFSTTPQPPTTLPPNKPCEPIEEPKCPPHDTYGFPVYLPDPNACNRFYLCDWEVLYHRPCPNGLHFNKNSLVCDWPKDAGCYCSISTNAPPTTTPSPSEPQCEPIPEPICPPHDVNTFPVYRADPNDCNKFYQCHWKSAYQKNCPPGLHFNRNLVVCDLPGDAGCDCSISTNPPPTTTPRPSEPLCEPIPEPICPPHDVDALPIYLADPNDCNKFYQCHWGIAYQKTCPNGLHFNRNLLVCDWSRYAGCDCSMQSTTEPSIEEPTTEEPSTEEPSTADTSTIETWTIGTSTDETWTYKTTKWIIN